MSAQKKLIETEGRPLEPEICLCHLCGPSKVGGFHHHHVRPQNGNIRAFENSPINSVELSVKSKYIRLFFILYIPVGIILKEKTLLQEGDDNIFEAFNALKDVSNLLVWSPFETLFKNSQINHFASMRQGILFY